MLPLQQFDLIKNDAEEIKFSANFMEICFYILILFVIPLANFCLISIFYYQMYCILQLSYRFIFLLCNDVQKFGDFIIIRKIKHTKSLQLVLLKEIMAPSLRQFHIYVAYIICFLLQNSDLLIRAQEFNFTLDQDFVYAAKGQLDQWVGYKNNQTFQEAISQCQLFEKAKEFQDFYTLMYQTGTNFTLKHIDVIRQQFKKHPVLRDTLTCIVDKSITDNPYFRQQKRYKYLARFIKSYDGYCKGVFPQFFGTKQKGRLIGHFFKAFFEYYYVNIYNPSQTLSTAFIRALTIRSDIFNHTDISYCLSLETAGAISNQLEGLDINNIYEKLPKFWQALKYMKFKEKCKDQGHMQFARNLNARIGNMDLYRLMYHDYQPYVQIAAEKFGTAQIRKLAQKVAQLIEQYEKFTEMSHQDY